jgi:hypothetical protein
MKKIHDFLKSHNIKTTRYEKKGKVYVIETDGEYYAIKKKSPSKDDIYKYLDSRHFHYYPEVLSDIEEEYEVTRYISGTDMPEEQRILDMIDLVALLHSKTTFYKEVEKDYFKKTYEDIVGNIEYLEEYYTDMITVVEKEIYPSPSSYLLARNINLIFSSLHYAKETVENWYEVAQNKEKVRFVVLHNNLKLDHFIKEKNAYLTSWDNAKIDIPIFDLYKLYKNHALDFDFGYVLKEYEKNYPLLEEERQLLFILISLPNKLVWQEQEFDTCNFFTKEIDLLYKTEKLINSYDKE